MITRNMVKQAYRAGIIKIIDSPNGDGAACGIGEHWFYFDIDHGEDHLAVDYEEFFDKDYIVDKIYCALEEMREQPEYFDTEYEYYESFILENLPAADRHANLMQLAAQKITELIDKLYKAKCEYYVMDDEYLSLLAYHQLSCDNHGNNLFKGDAYMIITVSNGYKYYVNVTADSVLTACSEVFNFIQYKM